MARGCSRDECAWGEVRQHFSALLLGAKIWKRRFIRQGSHLWQSGPRWNVNLHPQIKPRCDTILRHVWQPSRVFRSLPNRPDNLVGHEGRYIVVRVSTRNVRIAIHQTTVIDTGCYRADSFSLIAGGVHGRHYHGPDHWLLICGSPGPIWPSSESELPHVDKSTATPQIKVNLGRQAINIRLKFFRALKPVRTLEANAPWTVRSKGNVLLNDIARNRRTGLVAVHAIGCRVTDQQEQAEKHLNPGLLVASGATT